jgi:acetate kinase
MPISVAEKIRRYYFSAHSYTYTKQKTAKIIAKSSLELQTHSFIS